MERENTEIMETENINSDEKLFNFRPVFFVAVFLCVGIVFSYFTIKESVSFWWAVLFLPILLTPFIFANTPKKRKRTFFAVLALACALCIGIFSLCIQSQTYLNQKQVQGEAQIVGQVIEKEKTDYGASFTLQSVSIDNERVNGKLVAYLPADFYKNTRLGDWVILRAETENKGQNASVYDMENDVRYEAHGKEMTVTEHSFHLFLCIRERMCNIAYNGTSETNAGVMLALLLGDTSGIDNGLLENVRAGGIAHVFAVSGLHIGALFGFCLLVFSNQRLKKLSKLTRFLFVAAILLFYGGICGFSPSVIRAILTCLTAYAASLIGVGYESLETLGFACAAVLLLSPVSLFTVGFQLSFLAVLGIVLFARRIQRGMEKVLRVENDYKNRVPLTVGKRIVKSGIGIVSVSMSAQITTAPVLYLAFGYLSGWSLLLNFLFTPLISVCFSFLLLGMALACILPIGIAGIILYPFEILLSLLLLTFQVVDFSAFCLQGFVVPFGATVCYYLGILFLTDKWNMRKKQSFALAVVCVLSCAFLCTIASL